MTYQDLITNDIFGIVLVLGIPFVLWVGQMLFEVDEKIAGIVCGLTALLIVGTIAAERARFRQIELVKIQTEQLRIQKQQEERAQQQEEREQEIRRKKAEELRLVHKQREDRRKKEETDRQTAECKASGNMRTVADHVVFLCTCDNIPVTFFCPWTEK